MGLLAAAALVAALLWFFTGRPARAREPWDQGGEIDHAELEAAEREIKDLGIDARPEGDLEDDLGPGTSRSK
ncbi:MAG: hypothetical protein ACOY71_10560 [Gemmatimonadota bacterium]